MGEVAVERDDDADFRWPHYLLLARVEGFTWIAADPDLFLGALGLDLLTATGVDERGSAHASSFDDFVTEKQKAEAFTLKQSRLYAEEHSKNKGSSGGSGGPGKPEPRDPPVKAARQKGKAMV